MKTIWKFPLASEGAQAIKMPRGARILTVKSQYGKVCLWALVTAEATQEYRRIAIIGTGREVQTSYDERLVYISTFQLDGGALVFHAFEIVEDGRS